MSAPTLLVLAAGMGSRYGGLKQLDPVGPNGETIMDYSIFDALRAGFGKIVFIIRKDIEQAFQESVASRFTDHVKVECVFQQLDKLPDGFTVPEGRTKPWGTTHAILMATDAVKEPFAVINADDFYGAESYRVLAEQLQTGGNDDAMAEYSMAGFVLRNTLSEFGTVARGVCQVGTTGYLQGVVEMTKISPDGAHARNTEPSGEVTELTGDELVSMNMWGFTPAVFDQFKKHFEEFLKENSTSLTAECYIPNAVNALVSASEAKVKVLTTHDAWFGVTYREDKQHVVDSVNALIAKGLYPEKLWA
jgi:UTP-glucose-1-phosphate uridylyltransferase